MKRLPFLDWMRGLALVIMIECHVFNSFARMDVRDGGPYALSQFIGGMAGPLFLFMAGITFAFLTQSLEDRDVAPVRRWLICLRRAGYILAIAYLMRISDWVFTWPRTAWTDILRVDILNSMGLALAAFSVAAILDGGRRIRAVLLGAVAIAAFSPLAAGLNWDAAPRVLHEYMAPGAGGGHFPFFPNAAYLGFGMTAGAAVRLTEYSRMDRMMQWSALIGGAAILAGQYVSNLPYTVYPKSDFWTDSPTLVAMRVGIALVLLAGSYTWTAYGAGAGWSWMQSIGKNSLLVYWVHLVLVYGPSTAIFQHALSIPMTAVATGAVTALMVALAASWQWWKGRRVRRAAVSSLSPAGSTVPSPPLAG